MPSIERAPDDASDALGRREAPPLGVEPAFDCQLEVVVRVVSEWVHTEAAGGPMLKTPVDWQDHQLAGSRQPPMGQEER